MTNPSCEKINIENTADEKFFHSIQSEEYCFLNILDPLNLISIKHRRYFMHIQHWRCETILLRKDLETTNRTNAFYLTNFTQQDPHCMGDWISERKGPLCERYRCEIVELCIAFTPFVREGDSGLTRQLLLICGLIAANC
jgi:hypothetical protein